MRLGSWTAGSVRRRAVRLGVGLLVWNGVAWLWAVLVFREHPLLLGTALLAYGFGLRHAVDADHIAAIDNVTRKLLQQGRDPLAAGLYFSLGHSTVVTGLTVAVVIASVHLSGVLAHLKALGTVLGTAVSAVFLLAIAAANLAILAGTWRALRAARQGVELVAAAPVPGGLLARVWRRVFGLIQHSRQMYGVGVLFGLGFDTATEIGLLGVSAVSVARGLSPWAVLVLPALFSAGMALIDTADSVAMVSAYGGALIPAVRTLYYNLTLTAMSVLVALCIGGLEVLGLIGTTLRQHGALWQLVAAANDHFSAVGFAIVGLFALGWGGSVLLYRLRGYETA